MKALRWLDDYLEAIVIVPSIGAMSVIITVQVFFRYVLLDSLAWSEEVSRYLAIYLVYFGIAYGVRKGRHIKIDFLLGLMPEKAKKVMSLISDVLFLVFATVVTFQGIVVAETIGRLGQITGATQIPMFIVYLAVPLGYGLVSLRLVQNMIYKIRHFNDEFELFVNRGDTRLSAGEGESPAERTAVE